MLQLVKSGDIDRHVSSAKYRDHLAAGRRECRCISVPQRRASGQGAGPTAGIYAITAMIDDTTQAFTSSPSARRRCAAFFTARKKSTTPDMKGIKIRVQATGAVRTPISRPMARRPCT